MRSPRRGLTLIETLIAMLVLTVAILGLTAVFVNGLRMVKASTNLTGATSVGRELLETVKKRGYPATVVGQFDGRVPTPVGRGSNFPPSPYPTSTVDGHTYTLVVRCRNFSPTIRAVEVDVYWDRDSKTTFATMLHQ